jgi:pyridinium-3,5-biscarboxylic acid mononucleotide sulfurtransferase
MSNLPTSLTPELLAKRDRLIGILADLPSVAVALSGGIDSALMAAAAFKVLGDHAIALTADSPSVPRSDLADAERVAKLIGIRHQILRTREFDNPDYLKNDGSRCYFCKSELYTRIEAVLPELGIKTVVSGANLDDLGDYRPGLIAASEHQVRHPLQEAGFTKADVRALAQAWGLPVWDKPASPCLSSRVAPGLAVTPERTQRIEAAENFLKQAGFRECRVRYHEGDLARVEVPSQEVSRLMAEPLREELTQYLRQLGFRYVTIDLEGFRSGNLNNLIPIELKARFTPPGART